MDFVNGFSLFFTDYNLNNIMSRLIYGYMFYKAFLVRDAIKNNEDLECWLSCLRKKADEYKNSKVAEITKSDYNRYYTDGNRLVGENKYFDRRGRLSTYALMVCIYR